MEETEVLYEASCSLDPQDNVTIESNGEITVNFKDHMNYGVKLDMVEMREFASACVKAADVLENNYRVMYGYIDK